MGRLRPHILVVVEFMAFYLHIGHSKSGDGWLGGARDLAADNSDFVRTHLTHFIEVSAIARSTGLGIERQLAPHDNLQIWPTLPHR